MLVCVTELSEIIKDFMSRFHLKKAATARILGVSTNYVSSLVSGVDINTGLPFTPRESTLMQIAAKMTDFGYPMTASKLMHAAGLEVPAPLPLVEQIADAVNTARRAFEPEPVMSLINELGDVTYPPDAHERTILAEADRLGLSFGLFTEPGFWNVEPARRRRFLRDVENTIEEARDLYRLMGKELPNGS